MLEASKIAANVPLLIIILRDLCSFNSIFNLNDSNLHGTILESTMHQAPSVCIFSKLLIIIHVFDGF